MLMAHNSKIEWTDHTFNPWVGCTNISPGCDHCYAESWSKRSGLVKWGNSPRRRTSEAYWRAPLKWQAAAAAFQAQHGRRQRVFCASLADVFDNQADAAWRSDLYTLIRSTPSLDWLLLTKRPQNIRKMLPKNWGDEGYHNVWLGTTCEDQERFDQRWPLLAQIPAIIRFVSYEPAIGPVRLKPSSNQPDWLISGGESGHGARSLDPEWVRSIIRDCEKWGVAPFHKQWGAYRNNPLCYSEGLSAKEVEKLDSHGKGGGLLDGKLYRQFPKSRASAIVAA
jgi:protein gp37